MPLLKENICMRTASYKGQEISEGIRGVLKYSKKHTKFFPDFCPKGLKWVKIKTRFYGNWGLSNIIKCFFISSLGKKLGKNFIGFLEYLKIRKKSSEI